MRNKVKSTSFILIIALTFTLFPNMSFAMDTRFLGYWEGIYQMTEINDVNINDFYEKYDFSISIDNITQEDYLTARLSMEITQGNNGSYEVVFKEESMKLPVENITVNGNTITLTFKSGIYGFFEDYQVTAKASANLSKNINLTGTFTTYLPTGNKETAGTWEMINKNPHKPDNKDVDYLNESKNTSNASLGNEYGSSGGSNGNSKFLDKTKTIITERMEKLSNHMPVKSTINTGFSLYDDYERYKKDGDGTAYATAKSILSNTVGGVIGGVSSMIHGTVNVLGKIGGTVVNTSNFLVRKISKTIETEESRKQRKEKYLKDCYEAEYRRLRFIKDEKKRNNYVQANYNRSKGVYENTFDNKEDVKYKPYEIKEYIPEGSFSNTVNRTKSLVETLLDGITGNKANDGENLRKAFDGKIDEIKTPAAVCGVRG